MEVHTLFVLALQEAHELWNKIFFEQGSSSFTRDASVRQAMLHTRCYTRSGNPD